MPSFVTPLLKQPDRSHRLVNDRNGRVVAAHVLTAFDSASRRTGLLKHASMPEGTALIIAPCSAVHTFGMRFPIDVAFVARDGRVLKVRHAVGPRRMTAALGAFAVIELAAGQLAAADTQSGDMLSASD